VVEVSNSHYSIPLAEPITDTPDQPAAGITVVDLPDGCYRLTVRPALARGTYRGTLRVDRADGNLGAGWSAGRSPIHFGTTRRPCCGTSASRSTRGAGTTRT
jgi:hypothetical protein